MAEAFHPGEFLREELDARDWSQRDLADITGESPKTINEIAKEKRSINASLAVALGNAMGTSADYWLNLQSMFDLWKAQNTNKGEADEISRRAELYTFPIREMAKRGWIDDKATGSDELEEELRKFFETDSLISVAARKKDHAEPLTRPQIAWLYRIKHLAQAMETVPYARDRLAESIGTLRDLLQHPEDTENVARILADAGVRFLAVEGLSGIKLDGVCFWLGDTPVVAMTLRLDRVDNFWFVLRHEIEHVLNEDAKGCNIDQVTPDSETTMSVESGTGIEAAANKAAADFCVPHGEMEGFIGRRRRFSGAKIVAFAETQHVHPGIVVGQLHWQKKLPYKNLRRYLEKVRSYVIESAKTDGWGVHPE